MSKVALLKTKMKNRAVGLKTVQKTLGLSDEGMQKALELKMFKLTPSGKSASAMSINYPRFAKHFGVKIFTTEKYDAFNTQIGYNADGSKFEEYGEHRKKEELDKGAIDLSYSYTRWEYILKRYDEFIEQNQK